LSTRLPLRLLASTTLCLALAGMALAAPADDFSRRLQQADELADTNPAAASAALDALERDTAGDPLRRQAVLAGRCWLLTRTDTNAVPAWVEQHLSANAAPLAPAYAARLRVCRGYALGNGGKADLALADLDAGVAEGQRLQDAELLARAQSMRGELRGQYGQYPDALADLKAAYDTALAQGNRGLQLYTMNAIANLYADRNVKDYDNALQYYRKLLVAHHAEGETQNEATTYFNIASTLEAQDKLALAKEQFEMALALDRKRGVAADIAYDERALAVVLSKLGQHPQALKLLDHALAECQRQHDADATAMVQLSRGAALRRAGRPAQGLADLDAALAYYQGIKNLRFLDKVHEERALTLGALGNWREAYEARGAQMEVEKTLQQQLLDERSARLRVQFHTEQEQRNSAVLARENAVQQQALAAADTVRRWQLAALALSLVALAALGVMMRRQMALGRRMRDLAMTDELTRLPNRRHFLTLAHDAFALAHKQGTPLSLAALDIDYFKRVNDTHGHAAGDVVLQRVAHAARLALRPGDTIGRTGGEEFLVLLPGATLEEACGVAQRIRNAVAALDLSDLAPGLRTSVSIGMAAYRAGSASVEAVCKRADDALYLAKANGRDRVEMAPA
jgi:diguanylate cyclase (GGDEF)-like protein